MKLNTLSPEPGSRFQRKRVGRGIGSGLGKTCGRGHKGQKARSGGYHAINFEGGQMPIQRRLPKLGFRSKKSLYTAEVTLHEVSKVKDDVVTLETLKSNGILKNNILYAKIILSGEISVAKTVKGLRCTKGAKAAIEAAGGKIEE